MICLTSDADAIVEIRLIEKAFTSILAVCQEQNVHKELTNLKSNKVIEINSMNQQ